MPSPACDYSGSLDRLRGARTPPATTNRGVNAAQPDHLHAGGHMSDGAAVADPFGEPEAVALSPMELATRRVLLQRKKKALEGALDDVKAELSAVGAQLQTYVENRTWPE